MPRLRRIATLLLSLALLQTLVLGSGAACSRAATIGEATIAAVVEGPAGHEHGSHLPGAPSEEGAHHAALPCATAMACAVAAVTVDALDPEPFVSIVHAVVFASADRAPSRPAAAPEPPPPRA